MVIKSEFRSVQKRAWVSAGCFGVCGWSDLNQFIRFPFWGFFFLMFCSLIFQHGGSNQCQALSSILDWLVNQVGSLDVEPLLLQLREVSCEDSLQWSRCLLPKQPGSCSVSGDTLLGWAVTHLPRTLLSLLYSHQIFGVFLSVRSIRFTESSKLCNVIYELVGFF